MSFAHLKVRRKFFTGLFAFPKLFPPLYRLSNRTQQKGPLHVSKESLLTSYLITEQARFYRLAYSYLKNREEALDAVQTAVCRAWEQQDRLREPEAVRTWFYRILIHVCTDMLSASANGSPLFRRTPWMPAAMKTLFLWTAIWQRVWMLSLLKLPPSSACGFMRSYL